MKKYLSISILLLGLCLTSCNKEKSAPRKRPPASVEFVNPTQRKITSWDYYNGRLMAAESVDVRARVGGLLEEIHFKSGAKVAVGDLLYTLDKDPFIAAQKAVEAQLEQSKAALVLAESNFQRAQNLLKKNAIAKEEVDVRQGALAEARANVQVVEAELETATLNLSYTEVRSPIVGKIADHFITVGNLISGGSEDSTLLTRIVSIDPIHVRIDADEASVIKYLRLEKEGVRESARNTTVPVEMALDGDEGFPRKGKIDFVNNTFDSATATLRARAVFENPDGFLTPGMFAKVRLPGRGEYLATLIPERAIKTQQNLTTIYTLDEEDTVGSMNVTLGPLNDGMRVIETELDPKLRILVTGLTKVRPGAKVSAKKYQEKSDNPAKPEKQEDAKMQDEEEQEKQ